MTNQGIFDPIILWVIGSVWTVVIVIIRTPLFYWWRHQISLTLNGTRSNNTSTLIMRQSLEIACISIPLGHYNYKHRLEFPFFLDKTQKRFCDQKEIILRNKICFAIFGGNPPNCAFWTRLLQRFEGKWIPTMPSIPFVYLSFRNGVKKTFYTPTINQYVYFIQKILSFSRPICFINLVKRISSSYLNFCIMTRNWIKNTPTLISLVYKMWKLKCIFCCCCYFCYCCRYDLFILRYFRVCVF